MAADRLKTAVLASGGGTNLQALIDAAADPGYPAEIALVLTNNEDAYCLERAHKAGIATAVVDHRAFDGRAPFDAAIDAVLDDHGIETVCLAGFLRILTPEFVRKWDGRFLNIHPSLLPDYKGLHTHARALADGRTRHGCSVHYVVPDLDAGPLIVQASVPVEPDDTSDSLAARVLVQEHVIYPMALRLHAEGRLEIRGDTVFIDGEPGPLRIE